MHKELKIGALTFQSDRYDDLIAAGLITKNNFWAFWDNVVRDSYDADQEIEQEEAIALIALLTYHFDLEES